jgi:hypothetical protein
MATQILHASTTQRDTLRRAALKSAAVELRQAAEQFELLASDPDAIDMADGKLTAACVRDELHALDVLGWSDESMAAQAESQGEVR